MPRIELRDVTDEDRDAAFPLLQDGSPTWRRAAFAERSAFAAWIDEQLTDDAVMLQAVVVDGDPRGLSAVLPVDDDREIVFALLPGTDAAVTGEVVRQLTAREATRPLYACVSVQDDPAHDVLAGIGFVESERDGDEIVYVLPPTLE
ncbi:hypothetical protein ACFWZW_08570 [Microbacterium enclense]|uniref:hypothetical protein n=1 Tax=Microbacterium enclense TaxID=993073 RepID=UPI0036DDC5C4